MTTESRSSKPKVLIIGGGLGGLAFAQSLRKRGIPYQVFERDSSDGARGQGWAISLHPWFIDDLKASTPDDMPAIETVGHTYVENIPNSGAVFDARDMTEQVRMGFSAGDDMIRADRSKLRQWLLTDLEVNWNKRFERYEEDENGVTAYFVDGTSAQGDILVGCDGVRSQVRSQLLAGKGIEPQYVPMGSIVGELTATEEQYTRWMKHATSFFIGVADSRRMFVGLKEISEDRKTAKYYWVFGWVDKEAENESFWTVSASQQQLRDHILNDKLEGVHPDFVEIVRTTPVEGMLHPPLRLRDMTPSELPNGRVTLIGDSVHPMVPFRGEGGNMAMEDGFSLARSIDSMSKETVEKILKSYESEMIPRSTKSVLASRNAGYLEKQL